MMMKEIKKTLLVSSLFVFGAGSQGFGDFLLYHEFTNADVAIPDPGEVAVTENLDLDGITINDLQVGLQISGRDGAMFNGDIYAGIGNDDAYAVLLNRVGRTDQNPWGYGDNGFDVTFSDGAAHDIHTYRDTLGGGELDGPLTGAWQPSGRNVDPGAVTDQSERTAMLSEFQGTSAGGEWRLLLSDESAGGKARLDSWSLSMRVSAESPESRITLSGGSVRSDSPDTLMLSNAFELRENTEFSGSGQIEIGGSIQGNGGLIKRGGSTLVLRGANTFSGGTEVSGGTLVVLNTEGSATGDGDVTIFGDGRLAGSGRIGGDVSISDGGTIAPGESPGTMPIDGNLTWGPGGAYEWEINLADGEKGQDPGWDWLDIGGELAISATEENPFTISLMTLKAENDFGLLSDFDRERSYTWILATAAAGITGFDPALINLDTSGFSNITKSGWEFILVVESGNSESLTLSYIPEPRTYALMIGLFSVLILAGKRYRPRRVAPSSRCWQKR